MASVESQNSSLREYRKRMLECLRVGLRLVNQIKCKPVLKTNFNHVYLFHVHVYGYIEHICHITFREVRGKLLGVLHHIGPGI